MSKLDMDMSADPTEFVEAVEEFAARRVITREEADELEDYAKRRAFWISGVAQMDVVNDAHQSLLEAIAKGKPLEEWKKEVSPKLKEAWGRTDSFRIETIFRNATSQAFNAGREQQMSEPHIVAVRPYWMLDVVDDLRTSEVCHPFISPPVIMRADDQRWARLRPPFHHRCRTGIRSLRASTAEQKGITDKLPSYVLQDGWGYPPSLTEPPKPSERTNQPDPELALECAIKAGKDYRDRKSVTIPKRLVDAKAKPGKIELGKHVETEGLGINVMGVKSKPSAKQVRNVLSSLNEDELAVLERERLKRISIRDELQRGQILGLSGGIREEGAAARRLGGYIEIATSRTSLEFGSPFAPGKMQAVDECAESVEEATRLTFIHEFAHLLHLRAPDELYESTGADFAAGNPISEYAKTNDHEYFAESYVAYRIKPDELKSHDPVGYAMVRRFCDHYGIR